MPDRVLFEALDRDDVESVARALREDPGRAGAVDDAGVSLLLRALYRGHRELAGEISDLRPALDLCEAAALGRELEFGGAAPEQRSADGFTPLHLAAFFGHVDAMRSLLDAGADANATAENPSRVRPLHSAAAARSVAACSMLLEHRAEVDAQQAGGWTALMAACRHQLPELARLLVDAGADPDLTAEDGSSARTMLPVGEDPAAYGIA